MIALIVVVLIAVMAGVALAGGRSTVRDSVYNPPGSSSTAAPEQRCITLWNDPSNTVGQSLIAAEQRNGGVYVSVGFAAEYPGKCLVTEANPQFGSAVQFISGTALGGTYTPVGDGTGVSASSLPTSVTNWNAPAASDGTLTLD